VYRTLRLLLKNKEEKKDKIISSVDRLFIFKYSFFLNVQFCNNNNYLFFRYIFIYFLFKNYSKELFVQLNLRQ